MKLKYIADKYLMCIVLIIIALVQIYDSQFGRLTPWKGGGFGMFSTNKSANIAAIGYTSSGDSILINVEGSKYDLPISKSFLSATEHFPKEEKLNKLAHMIVNSYLKPSTLEIPLNIDKNSNKLIKDNPKFYTLIYTPKYYQNLHNAKLENALEIYKVKIILYETDFSEEGLMFKKRFIDEVEATRIIGN